MDQRHGAAPGATAVQSDMRLSERTRRGNEAGRGAAVISSEGPGLPHSVSL